MLAVAISTNPLLILLIGIGFTLNAFQIICNCYIGVTGTREKRIRIVEHSC